MGLGTLDRHCAIGRIRIKPEFRNHGYSLGLDYPFIHQRAGARTWLIWNRHTGRVMSVLYDVGNEFPAERMAHDTSAALNGHWEHDPAMNALHDLVA